ncbi:MAG: penicillin-binding protein 2 [Deltaproteobacteria bacterium]|nr:penicillin-binding protein 2 [Deltaproteobacteria bacterium]
MKVAGGKQQLASRFLVFGAVVCLAYSFLGVRLWYLQGIQGSYYRDLSENNRTRTVRTVAQRGRFFDRDSRLLVGNRPAFDLALMMEDVTDVEKLLLRLAQITDRDVPQLRAALQDQRRDQPFEPKVIVSDISREELARVMVHRHELPGVIVRVTPSRMYPYQDYLSHQFGYVRQISKTQLFAMDDKWYKAGDKIGQSGLEKQWERRLRGETGYLRLEVDAHGNRRQELGIVDAQAGSDIYLTIDLDLQMAAEEALEGQRGAVVAIDPRNGEILAMASSPSFDANVFSGEMSGDQWLRIAKDPTHPLNNRAIATTYAPGSTFKLIMGIAGLAEGAISSSSTYNCPGFYYFAGRRYHCHKRAGHGTVDLKKAITVSCDSFFYQLGQALGIDNIARYAKMFGLGNVTGVRIPGEKTGVVPSQEWKMENLGERWYRGETLSVSIGQGFMSATPLQLANATAAISSFGKIYRPMIVSKIVNIQTGETEEFLPESRDLPVDLKALSLIRNYAKSVVEDPSGTGKRAAVPGIEVAGKTGTAQVVALGKEGDSEKYKDHALFVSFAPFDEPSIAMAVVVENGGHGGETAAPISKKVMEVYFRKHGVIPAEEVVVLNMGLRAGADS